MKISEGEKILFVMNIDTEKEKMVLSEKYLECTKLIDCFSGKTITSKEGNFQISLDGLDSRFYFCK